MTPLIEAMQVQMRQFTSSVIPEIMEGPTARSRQSLLNLEKSLAEWPERLRAAEEEMDRVLNSARVRTQALERWLTVLS